VEGDPDVDVISCSGVAVISDGIPADQQVLNPMSVEQAQELFEVVR
jgi:hypothetical protein